MWWLVALSSTCLHHGVIFILTIKSVHIFVQAVSLVCTYSSFMYTYSAVHFCSFYASPCIWKLCWTSSPWFVLLWYKIRFVFTLCDLLSVISFLPYCIRRSLLISTFFTVTDLTSTKTFQLEYPYLQQPFTIVWSTIHRLKLKTDWGGGGGGGAFDFFQFVVLCMGHVFKWGWLVLKFRNIINVHFEETLWSVPMSP